MLSIAAINPIHEPEMISSCTKTLAASRAASLLDRGVALATHYLGQRHPVLNTRLCADHFPRTNATLRDRGDDPLEIDEHAKREDAFQGRVCPWKASESSKSSRAPVFTGSNALKLRQSAFAGHAQQRSERHVCDHGDNEQTREPRPTIKEGFAARSSGLKAL